MDATIEPTSWSSVLATLAGAALTIIAAATPILLLWLRNVRAQLDRQYIDLRENTELTRQSAQSADRRLQEQIRLNIDLQRENYTLRRLIDALELDDDGLRALALARARVEAMRIRPRPAPRGSNADRAALERMLRLPPASAAETERRHDL